MQNLSPDQKFVLDALLSWHKEGHGDYITLGGYAGTGKTTLISLFRKALYKKKKKLKVAFVSYTGKAARVLDTTIKKSKAIYKGDFVGTIHSLIYSPIVDKKTEEIVGWEKKESLKYDLIIVDEASMVDQEIWQDLLSYKTPIIAVGDHGQLPPIRGKFNLMEKPKLKLEQIHRQLQDNPIIKVSIFARRAGQIPHQDFSSTVRKLDRADEETGEIIEDLLSSFSDDTLVLCGYNHTRTKLNNYIRSLREIHDQEPQVGDRVICLRNNHKKQIFNGMLGKIQHIEEDSEDWYYAEIEELDEGHEFKGLILKEQFSAQKPTNMTKNRSQTLQGDLFDFGYALTVHKAQGSQSKRVILFEERFKQMDDEMWRRWLYTGVTRAEEELYVIG